MNDFFAGANSCRGFVSFFEEICAPFRRVYILKGGSGCGKSSFMKNIAAEARRKGDTVQCIYCSSDPKSLDGVLLPDRGVAVLDGTAPHVYEPHLAGAADCLVDLGECWDSAKLRCRREEIESAAAAKAACYRRAYALLAGAGKLRGAALDLRRGALKKEKLRAFAARRAAAFKKGTLSKRTALLRAFNGDGLCFMDNGGTAVFDPFDMADSFFSAFLEALDGKGGKAYLSYDPLDTARLDGIALANCAYYKSETRSEGCVNMERFVDKSVLSGARAKLRLLEKAKERLLDAAKSELAEARRHHEELEAIYTPTVDFSKVDERREAVKKDIFG